MVARVGPACGPAGCSRVEHQRIVPRGRTGRWVLVVPRLEWAPRPWPGCRAGEGKGSVAGSGWAWGCWHTVGSWDNRTGRSRPGGWSDPRPWWGVVVPGRGPFRVEGSRGPGSGRVEASFLMGEGVECAVRVVVWELHSGREHLIFIAAMITPPGVVWWRRECSHL